MRLQDLSQPISTSNECALRSRVATMVNITASAVTSRLGLNPESTFVTIGVQSSRNRYGRGPARAIVLLSQMPRSMNYTIMPTFVLKGVGCLEGRRASDPPGTCQLSRERALCSVWTTCHQIRVCHHGVLATGGGPWESLLRPLARWRRPSCSLLTCISLRRIWCGCVTNLHARSSSPLGTIEQHVSSAGDADAAPACNRRSCSQQVREKTRRRGGLVLYLESNTTRVRGGPRGAFDHM